MNEYRLQKFDGSIFICGFMGTGKSTIGKLLAEQLDRPFKDLDEVIVEKENKSIQQIFELYGEGYFRQLEWKYLLELTQTFKGIVALGGGALHNQQVVDHLKVYGLLVFIKTPVEAIVERVRRNPHRPIVRDEDGKIKSRETLFAELKALYSSRLSFYEQAQIKLESDGYAEKDSQVSALIKKLQRYV